MGLSRIPPTYAIPILRHLKFFWVEKTAQVDIDTSLSLTSIKSDTSPQNA